MTTSMRVLDRAPVLRPTPGSKPLVAALGARPPALHNWGAFPPSTRRALLVWIAWARRDATRARRFEKTAAAASASEPSSGVLGREARAMAPCH